MKEDTGPISRTFFSQRLRLHYIDWGNSEAPPLVLVHGGRDHCRNWDWIVERFRQDWHIITPDLRGHGDSDWATDSTYSTQSYIYDLAQLIDQQCKKPVTLVGHSLGGRIVLRYSGVFPEKVKKLVVIEGFGPGPITLAKRVNKTMDERMRLWIDEQRAMAARIPRRYPTLEDARKRVQEENARLSPEQIRHLTLHSVKQNEDGTYSWKFDNYVRLLPPYDMAISEQETLWSQITCPTLLVNGSESWAPNAEADGKTKHFKNARAVTIDRAGHWLHHDRLDEFCGLLGKFLKE